MEPSQIIKVLEIAFTTTRLLAIGFTILCIFRNNERASNVIGWFLILGTVLPFFDYSVMRTIGALLQLLTILVAVVLTLKKVISVENKSLLIPFLMIALINDTTGCLMKQPNNGIFIGLTVVGILLYSYFQLRYRKMNILTITTIPATDLILRLTTLIIIDLNVL